MTKDECLQKIKDLDTAIEHLAIKIHECNGEKSAWRQVFNNILIKETEALNAEQQRLEAEAEGEIIDAVCEQEPFQEI